MTDEQYRFPAHRRLSDGVTIMTNESGHPDWIYVNITSSAGAVIYQGTMRTDEAFSEIPFQLDRAREFARAYFAKYPEREPIHD